MLAPLPLRPSPPRLALFEHLMSHARGLQNDEPFAHLLAGWAMGDGVLPADLGLGQAGLATLVARHFGPLVWRPAWRAGEGPVRQPEFEDLLGFLVAEADPEVAGSREMATVLACAAMGAAHLWQDLGLPSRGVLSQLIALNFPGLARANHRDMKWKKFLYRELCQREGIYVCASPSCEACSDYRLCFGPET